MFVFNGKGSGIFFFIFFLVISQGLKSNIAENYDFTTHFSENAAALLIQVQRIYVKTYGYTLILSIYSFYLVHLYPVKNTESESF